MPFLTVGSKMKKKVLLFCELFFALVFTLTCIAPRGKVPEANRSPRTKSAGQPKIRAAYFSYWANGSVSELPVGIFTHMIYFYAPYGNVRDLASPGPNDGQLRAFISYCRTNNIQPMISIASGDWQPEVVADSISATVHKIMVYCSYWGFLGVDIDFEFEKPNSNWILLIKRLRDSLDTRGPANRAISAYVTYSGVLDIEQCWIPVQDDVTFLNVSAYDFIGTWNGYVTHYSPLYGGVVGGAVIDDSYKTWEATGFPMSKFCLGGTPNGQLWQGGTKCRLADGSHFTDGAAWPGQIWSGGTSPNGQANQRYDVCMPGFQGYPILWDTMAQSSFISVDNPGSANDKCFCFNDGHTLARKWRYAVDSSLAGVYVWDAGTAYLINNPPGQRWPVYREWADSLKTDLLRQAGKQGKR